MEVTLLSFPHIGYQIFDQLENPFLTSCREVSKSWNGFIDNEKLPWIVQHIKPLASPWKIFLHKSNYNSLVEIASSVIQYYKEFNCVPENTVPLHFAAITGNTEIIEGLIQKGTQLIKIWGARICKKAWLASNQALADRTMTDLKILLQHKKNKRFEPEMDSFHCIPLHCAARNGHLTAYQDIMEIS